jgi:hypothetical protein
MKEVVNKNIIHTIRGVQIIIDVDIARLYEIPTKRLNEQVRRNIERFPRDFMFQLTKLEMNELVAKCDHLRSLRFSPTTSYAFTEQGVAMLSGLLRSNKAIEVNIQIMRAFVEMRRFFISNTQLFQRLDSVEKKQLEYDNKFEQVFKAIGSKIIPSKGIFFNGQVFDAYSFVSDLIRSAKKSIILIDNYVDDTVLTLFSKRNINVTIYTKEISKKLKLDLEKYNSQYKPIKIKPFTNSHDRFMIIDDKEVYHIGASLKDVGKKWFAFSKFNKEALNILQKIEVSKE